MSDEGNENGTFLDDPNREAVGLEPAWVEGTGGDQSPPEGANLPAGPPEGDAESVPFDPGEHTVAEVEEYVIDHPDDRDRVLDAERSGKDRTTLVGWLEG